MLGGLDAIMTTACAWPFTELCQPAPLPVVPLLAVLSVLFKLMRHFSCGLAHAGSRPTIGKWGALGGTANRTSPLT